MILTIIGGVVNAPKLYMCVDENGQEHCIDFSTLNCSIFEEPLASGTQIGVRGLDTVRERATEILFVREPERRSCCDCAFWKKNIENTWGGCQYPVPQWATSPNLPSNWNADKCKSFTPKGVNIK